MKKMKKEEHHHHEERAKEAYQKKEGSITTDITFFIEKSEGTPLGSRWTTAPTSIEGGSAVKSWIAGPRKDKRLMLRNQIDRKRSSTA